MGDFEPFSDREAYTGQVPAGMPVEESFGDYPMPASGLATNYGQEPASTSLPELKTGAQHGTGIFAPVRQEPSDAYGLPFFPFEHVPVIPEEPAPGTVIGFTKRYTEDGPGYSFAGIHVARLGWYLTGPKYSGHPVTWETLLDFIGGPDEWAAVGVVTGWAPLAGS